MALNIIRQDITKVKADAIVNAANEDLQMGGGVCGAIFRAAGAKKLQAACNALAPIETGKATITEGFDLPAKFIIHTAGPVWRGGNHREEKLLFDCYTNSMKLALENKCESIAFPLISSGIYGYPKKEALRVAIEAIRSFLKDADIEVTLVLYDKEALAVSEELLLDITEYIDQHYVREHTQPRRRLLSSEKRSLEWFEEAALAPALSHAEFAVESAPPETLKDLVGDLDEPFSVTLMRLIDAKGIKKDSDVYHKANIDRRLFSKIRSNEHYTPSKSTVLALAIALELSLEQTNDLLERAGFALSRSRKFDVIVEYFIKVGKYDIFEINEVLFYYDQPLLKG